MPNILDLPTGHKNWTEQENNLYHQLPYALTKSSIENMRYFAQFPKLMPSVPWTPRSGTKLKTIRKERSPILRGQFLPNTIQQAAKRDVTELTEVSTEAQLYHHKNESQLLHYLSDFQDFLENAEALNKDLDAKASILIDLFYRTAIFHGSPTVWIAGFGPMAAPHWSGPTLALSKDANFLKAAAAKVGGTITLPELARASAYFKNDVRADFFSGKVNYDGTDGAGLQYKHLFLTSDEVWQNFQINDAFLLDNRQIDLNITTAGFTGSLWGRLTTKFEQFEMRFKSSDGIIQKPETTEAGAGRYDKGEVIADPDYLTSDMAVGFLIGGEAYKIIKPGAPPAPFSSGKLSMEAFSKMDWNGKVTLTRDVLIQEVDETAATILNTNKYGEYGQFISKIAMGIIDIRRRNIMPIIYRRARPAT